MTGRRHTKIGNFALDPERVEPCFKRALDQFVQFADGEKLSVVDS